MFGVLRRDGVVIPFAVLSGGQWRSPWPTSLRHRALPLNLESIPEAWWGGARRAWRVFRPDAGIAELEIRRPVTVPTMCDVRLGLSTTYPSAALVPPVEGPHPKDGLAFAGAIDIRPIERLPAGDRRRASLPARIRDEVGRAEERAIRAASDEWRHPVGRKARGGYPFEIEELYAATAPARGATTLYFEGAKRYPAGPRDDGCGPETFVRGWLQEDGERLVPVGVSAVLTYCDRAGASYLLPLGSVEVGRRSYWLVQYSGWDHEWYSVVRIEPRSVRPELDYFAGACRTGP
jgi:hypothetical protein